jgi:hypothetical protein
MKAIRYAIVRYGSNAANQSIQLKRYLAVVEASTGTLAVERFKRTYPNCTVYNNQYLDAVPLSRLSRSERDALNDT